MVSAALSNTQVYWILCDDDIYSFFSRLLDFHADDIDEKSKAVLSSRLEECRKAVDTTDVEITDIEPF
jgi:hypothetical protein